ncbi:hypothetical protein [Cellulomonas chengniuliangii]|uniref:Uncharacterized protein n=1 Tax=Cellulomonas chengniuliangii TaxID=2968084 RepID=A0ABY5L049_9CELL|nr:hypothetical protein [Cellulomonas chengniuliangii]MCC2307988.1 hypothetical protein [Cellulomonas chengniuliangii]UUI75264.1 hypothetical protein NP064_16120 [Cellulomonas chengniuliangii]
MNAPTAPRGSTLVWVVGLAAVTLIAYLALLGWDQSKTLDPVTQNETGPYEAWQVIALVVVLGAAAFLAGRAGRLVPALVTIPVVLTLAFAVDAATDKNADGLWPIGAALVALGSAVGVALVAAIGQRSRQRQPA